MSSDCLECWKGGPQFTIVLHSGILLGWRLLSKLSSTPPWYNSSMISLMIHVGHTSASSLVIPLGAYVGLSSCRGVT